MGRAIRIGKLFGIPIYLHFSWFIVFIYLTVLLAQTSGLFPNLSLQMRIVGAAATTTVFFLSVLLHELAHSLLAIRTGIPVKSITLFIFGGVAQITREVVRPKDELQIALAGPLCSITTMGLLVALWFALPAGLRFYISVPVAWLALMNLVIAVFNSLPGFPLDGGRVLRALIWRSTGNYKRSTQIAAWSGRCIGYVFIIVGVASLFTSQLRPAPAFADFLGLYGSLWMALVGWILETAASGSYRKVERQLALESRTAADAMLATFPYNTPASLNVLQLVQSYGASVLYHDLPVVDQGKIQGVVTLATIKSIPQPEWERTQVASVMTSIDKVPTARPSDGAVKLLAHMEEHDLKQVLIIDGESVIGVVTRDSLLRFVQSYS